MKKIIFILMISLVQMGYAKYGMDFTTGNSNYFDLSSYNKLLKVRARSMPYGVTQSGQRLDAEKDVTAQISKIENNQIKGTLKILSIQKVESESSE
ncbi:MAG: hypothetical protein ACRCR2_05220 [Fusobacteriaceae bacterium]